MFQRPLHLLAAAGLAWVAFPALADGDGERAALARLVHEIEALEPIISEAEREADADARIRFQYDWLRVDLARMRLAIQEHLEAPSAEPRTVPPLRGDYRR
jgi:RAQPRD family integrative conjugative element protein